VEVVVDQITDERIPSIVPEAPDAFASVFGITLRLDPLERAAQVGRLCGMAAMLLRSSHPLVVLLREAERDDEALARALDVIAALPTLARRRLVCTFGFTQWALKPRPEAELAEHIAAPADAE
jgi:hypothetical protein